MFTGAPPGIRYPKTVPGGRYEGRQSGDVYT